MKHDVLDWIRSQLMACQPSALALVDPVLQAARQEYGGDTVYLRSAPLSVSYNGNGRIETRKVTRRTVQNRQKTGR